MRENFLVTGYCIFGRLGIRYCASRSSLYFNNSDVTKSLTILSISLSIREFFKLAEKTNLVLALKRFTQSLGYIKTFNLSEMYRRQTRNYRLLNQCINRGFTENFLCSCCTWHAYKLNYRAFVYLIKCWIRDDTYMFYP